MSASATTTASRQGSQRALRALQEFERAAADGEMKRSIVSLLRAIGARSKPLPHRRLTEAIRAGDEEQARVICRAMVLGTRADRPAVHQ